MDGTRNRNWATLVLAVLLAAGALVVFLPALDNDFTRFDDGGYVVHNAYVLQGLTWKGVAWAFTTGTESNWHPLTWLSHMLDVQLFGVNPRGHHFTNIVFHSANTALLFLLLNGLTATRWRSAFVAALFAVHPLHVESVAWVAERKDVLSTFLFLLTLLAYTRYVQGIRSAREPIPSVQPLTLGTKIHNLLALNPGGSARAYAAALVLYALGLMSKPMLVTTPFVMLLLDFWPLSRFKFPGSVMPGTPPSRTLIQLVREKVPFFALATLSSLVTLIAQEKAQFMRVPFGFRVANAFVSYWLYLGKLFWPVKLAVYYPHPHANHTALSWPAWEIGLAVVLLAGISTAAFWLARRAPWFVTGWFWFVGTLVPVIGLIQVGGQAMADRYAYIPSIGVFVLVVWGIGLAHAAGSWLRWPLAAGGLALLVVCSALTRQQLGYWKDDFTLFSHALQVTDSNSVAYYHTGAALAEQGNTEEAMDRFRKAIAITPAYAAPYVDMGLLYEKQGKTDQAVQMARMACLAAPRSGKYQNHLGTLLWRLGHSVEAIRAYAAAVRCEPRDFDAQYNLGSCLNEVGRSSEAIEHLAVAAKLRPDDFETREALGAALMREGRLNAAEEQFNTLSRLSPTNPLPQLKLGALMLREGRLEDALAHYRQALKLEPNSSEGLNGLAWILATSPRAEMRNGAEAVRLAERACQLSGGTDPRFWSTLDAAYAEAGRFADAIRTGEKARDLARAAGREPLAQAAEARLALYRQQQPFHQ